MAEIGTKIDAKLYDDNFNNNLIASVERMGIRDARSWLEKSWRKILKEGTKG